MSPIMKKLNSEFQNTQNPIETYIGIPEYFSHVFGSSDFIDQYPTLFTTGIQLCKLENDLYYIIKDNKVVGDCAFFSEEEIKNHFIKPEVV